MRELRAAGARFVTLFLAETPELALTAVFALRGELVVLQAYSDRASIPYQALGEWWPATPGPSGSCSSATAGEQ